jgi:hypothetical protein
MHSLLSYTLTIQTLSTFSALYERYHLLKTAIDILNAGDNDMCILHVPGVDNAVADALSRANSQHAIDLVPGLKISHFETWSWSPDDTGSLTFQPPRGTLGVDKL